MTRDVPRQLVKVQLSLESTANKRQMLVYSRDGYWWEGDADEEAVRAMDGEPKAFFYATIKDGVISLDERAPWQSW